MQRSPIVIICRLSSAVTGACCDKIIARFSPGLDLAGGRPGDQLKLGLTKSSDQQCDNSYE